MVLDIGKAGLFEMLRLKQMCLAQDATNLWVVVKIMVPFWVP